MTTLKPCAFVKWSRFDLWELRQSAFILNGYEPPELADLHPAPVDPYGLTNPSPPNWADFLAGAAVDRRIEPGFKVAVSRLQTLIRALELAGISGALLAEQHFVDSGYETYFKPEAVVRWAKAHGYPIPPELESIAGAVTPISEGNDDRPEYSPADLLSVIGRLLALLKDQQLGFIKGGGTGRRPYNRAGKLTIKAITDDMGEVAKALDLSTVGCAERKTRGILAAAIKVISEKNN